ncbi:hypothetical protein A8M77_21520 [Variovorax sp. JS1663]|nr:hypothetical protein A8M77_21520 [Variovorax sp. JS1663]
MNKKSKVKASNAPDYNVQLHLLQIELVKLQRHFIGCGDRILLPLEGRDAAGKDGTVKRIVEHLSPHEPRVVALGKACGVMLLHHHATAPWTVRADDKEQARLTPCGTRCGACTNPTRTRNCWPWTRRWSSTGLSTRRYLPWADARTP